MLDLLSMVSVARSVRPRPMTGSPEVVARQRAGPYDDFERRVSRGASQALIDRLLASLDET